ncbi:MAG: transglutaminase domain-containing protein, partial [Candidatus Neomarinimicrobiota bacterium]
MRRYFPDDDAVFYGNTFIYSSGKQAVDLRIGTSGALKVFLNDELMIECRDENNNGHDTYSVATVLQPGWNRLLIKCCFSEIAQCNFAVRLTDPEGNSLSDLKISSAPQSYTSCPGAGKQAIPNFAESYFLKQIEQHPEYLENYLLLAESYALNDKAIESELILRQALARAPNNAMIYLHLIEAYLRGEKFDEVSTAFEKIYQLDPNIPAVLERKITEYIEKKNFDEAKVLLDRLAQLIPESPNLQSQYIVYYSKRGLNEKIIETVNAAYLKFPDNWSIVESKAMIASYVKQSYKEGIPILRKYLKKHTDQNAFLKLADYYQKASDFKGWEKTYRQALNYYPAAPGYLYQMARNYYNIHDYSSATRCIEESLKLCPQCAIYWGTRAEIERSSGQTGAVIQSYKRALELKPTYYEARDNLRELQNNKSIFANFDAINSDSLFANSPKASEYPGESAVVLYNSCQRVVYSGGATESRQEFLTKVFNSDGIDNFKEYWIAHNGYNEELIVEKALTLKKDGSKIEADIDDNHIVFKSLEPNEAIYLKWKIRSYYAGKLSQHFWDDINFNLLYPVRDIRYALLVPPEVRFQVAGQNMSKEPALQKVTPDGVLYQWQLTDEPAVKEEYRMPGLTDVGKILHISSIPDWNYIINWYVDLAEAKTRSSYEIDEFLKELLPANTVLTEPEKVTRIYNFITEKIRYSDVPFRQSRLIPQKARDVFVNRIGDCKDKAALAIAMLRAAGLDANFVLVNTRDEGLNRNILPSIAFNHAIASVVTAQGKYYLDLTAQNFPVGSVPLTDQEAFALEIKGGGMPFYLNSEYFTGNTRLRRTKVDINPDNSISVTLHTTRHGAQTADIRSVYRFKNKSDRFKELIESLAQDYPNAELTDFEVIDIDSITPVLDYEYKFKAPNYLTEAGGMLILRLPWADKLTPTKALSYESRTYPFSYWPNADTIREEIEIRLPAGYQPMEFTPRYDYHCSTADYYLDLSFREGILRGTRQLVNKKSVVPPESYLEFKEFYNRIVKADGNQILIKRL